MKAIIEYTLPEEEVRLEYALKSEELVFAMQHFFQTIFRSRIKYGLSPEELSMSREELLEKIKDEMWQELNERNLGGLIWP